MNDIFDILSEETKRYVGRKCHPKENGLLYFALNSGYIQLDKRQKWEMEYVPEHDTCFMRYKQLRVKISTAVFMQMFTLDVDPCNAAKREMDKIWRVKNG